MLARFSRGFSLRAFGRDMRLANHAQSQRKAPAFMGEPDCLIEAPADGQPLDFVHQRDRLAGRVFQWKGRAIEAHDHIGVTGGANSDCFWRLKRHLG